MQPKTVLEAVSWLNTRKELEGQLAEHVSTCKHWAYGAMFTIPHRDAQFPDEVYAVCSYCGAEIRQ